MFSGNVRSSDDVSFLLMHSTDGRSSRAVSGHALSHGRDGQPMAFAGLLQGFKWPDGTVLRTFIIITVNANVMMAELHDRMPVILEQPDWSTWLGEVKGGPAALLKPAAEDALKVWPVSRQVNSPRNNGPELLETVG